MSPSPFVGAVAVLELMAEGQIRSDVLAIGFDQIPESIAKLQAGGVRGRRRS